jgi:hypothetical protein
VLKQQWFRRKCKWLKSCSLFLALPAFLLYAGCAKDYSYEQKPEQMDTTVGLPTVPPTVVASCSACTTATLPDSSWRLLFDGVVYCGVVDRAIITLERTAFTFFGPSFCSSDSGFVASVQIENDKLDSDKAGVRAKLGCYYYDNVGQSFLFMSPPGQPLQLIITSYVHQTRTATGTFSGAVGAGNGAIREVKNGRFHFRF